MAPGLVLCPVRLPGVSSTTYSSSLGLNLRSIIASLWHSVGVRISLRTSRGSSEGDCIYVYIAMRAGGNGKRLRTYGFRQDKNDRTA